MFHQEQADPGHAEGNMSLGSQVLTIPLEALDCYLWELSTHKQINLKKGTRITKGTFIQMLT